jgi:hypothetical protein
MSRRVGIVLFAVSVCALVANFNAASYAGTIIKLSLGSVSPDIKYDGTTLSTADDSIVATTGQQNTAVEFTDFLESIAADIPTSVASFTMSGLTPSGSAFVFLGQNVVQNFTGGTLTLYAPDNSILLSGNLFNSALSGSIGFPSGGLFTTSFGGVTGGSLAQYMDPTSLVLSMNFTKVQTTGGPVGFSVNPPPANPAPQIHMGVLNPFTADASINIAAETPEPTTFVLFFAGALALHSVGRFRRARQR